MADQTAHSSSDCRSEIGMVIGMIDGMLAMARFVANYLQTQPTIDQNVMEAMADFTYDESIEYLTKFIFTNQKDTTHAT